MIFSIFDDLTVFEKNASIFVTSFIIMNEVFRIFCKKNYWFNDFVTTKIDKKELQKIAFSVNYRMTLFYFKNVVEL